MELEALRNTGLQGPSGARCSPLVFFEKARMILRHKKPSAKNPGMPVQKVEKGASPLVG